MTTHAARVEALFHAAVELDGATRTRYLDSACRGDPELRRELEALLALDAREDPRFSAPAPRVLALDSPRLDLLVGRDLGPYHLVRCIAAGGMGTVFEAQQENPRRSVAVKVLRADLASRELEHRFRVESSLLARLKHPGIAHVYGADVALIDGLRIPYIALELVEGARTILEHARASGSSVADRLELFAAVCEAVHHGHQNGVIHRDLKPANILVDRSGRPKLIDFGIARAIDPEEPARRTEAGTVLGTVQYMSPEQCADARDSDVRSDVYSLGVLLYELLCGCLPHDLAGATLLQAARLVQETPPRRPSTTAGGPRGDLEAILLKALEKERERRYQTAAELALDLRRYLRREPVSARAPSVSYRVRLLARRHKAFAASLAAILVAAIATTVVSARFAWRERRARAREELQTVVANLAAADASLRAHDSTTARARLGRVPVEHRGWEWRHLESRLDLSRRRFDGPLERCEGLDWSGSSIAAAWQGEDDGALVLWEAASDRERARHATDAAGRPSKVALLPDGSVLWGSVGGALGRWWPDTGILEQSPRAHSASIEALELDGRGWIVTASIDGSVRRFDPSTLAEDAVLLEGGTAWSDMALDPRGERAALAGSDGSVRVLDLRGGSEGLVLAGHARPVLAVAFHPSGELLASGSSDGSLRLWDLASRRTVRRFYGHEGDVSSLAFLAGGAWLASGSSDRTLRLWEVESGAPRTVLHGHEGWIGCLATDPAGAGIVSGARDGSARLWDPLATEEVARIGAHRGIVRRLAFSPDGQLLATASFDRTARLHDGASGRELAVLAGHEAPVMSAAFHPQGDLVATASNDGKVRLWSVPEGQLLATLAHHRDGVHVVHFSPDGQWLASGAKDGRLLLYDAQSLALERELVHGAWLWGAAFEPSARRLATCAEDGKVRCWSVATGVECWSVDLGSPVGDLALSRGGELALGAKDGRIEILDFETGAPRATLRGHAGNVSGVAWSPAGDRLASVSEDGTVRLWDPAARLEMLVLRGHESWVQCVAFSPDGSRLATGGGNYDGTGVGVRLWFGGQVPR